MNEEFYFKCELCGEKCVAHPDTILECSADFSAVDQKTGEMVYPDEETKKQLMKEAENDPEIAPFLKGTIFMCLDCQTHFKEEAEKKI